MQSCLDFLQRIQQMATTLFSFGLAMQANAFLRKRNQRNQNHLRLLLMKVCESSTTKGKGNRIIKILTNLNLASDQAQRIICHTNLAMPTCAAFDSQIQRVFWHRKTEDCERIFQLKRFKFSKCIAQLLNHLRGFG